MTQMDKLTDCYALNNGVRIPCVGFGTWQTPDGEVAVSAVEEALKLGYRHIDTAAIYGNEKSVGEAIRKSGIDRKDLFITTKLWNDEHGYENTLKAFEESMNKLGLDYLDLYLIHWPNPIKYRDSFEKTNAETWRAMEELYASGKIRAIGVSNYMPHHLEALLKTAKVVPAVNQLRIYPGIDQKKAIEFSKEQGILPQAYSPLGTGKLLDVPELATIAQKYNKSVAQICLRWSLQMGYLPLPKSVTASRIKENTEIFDFVLDDTDMFTLITLQNYCGPSRNPDEAPH